LETATIPQTLLVGVCKKCAHVVYDGSLINFKDKMMAHVERAKHKIGFMDFSLMTSSEVTLADYKEVFLVTRLTKGDEVRGFLMSVHFSDTHKGRGFWTARNTKPENVAKNYPCLVSGFWSGEYKLYLKAVRDYRLIG
jgi:hypothetical protein